jgi:hypothetical protein
MGAVCAVMTAVEVIDAIVASATAAATAAAATAVVTATVAAELATLIVSAVGIDATVIGAIADFVIDGAIEEGLDGAADWIGSKVVSTKLGSKSLLDLTQKIATQFESKASGVTFQNLAHVFGKVYKVVSNGADAVKAGQTAAKAAAVICCVHSGCENSMNTTFAKCQGNHNDDEGGRRLSENLQNVTRVTMQDTTLRFPRQLLCGNADGTPVTVNTFGEAVKCYSNQLRNMYLQVQNSRRWDNVLKHGCTVVLYGAQLPSSCSNVTDCKLSEVTYCNSFLDTTGRSGATYEKYTQYNEMTNTFDRAAPQHYAETPNCIHIEEATRSMLLSTQLLAPTGLLPFFWSPDDSCVLPLEGVRVKRILPEMPIPDEPSSLLSTIIVIVSVTVGALILVCVITTSMHLRTHRLLIEAKTDRAQKEQQLETAEVTPLLRPSVPYLRTRAQ